MSKSSWSRWPNCRICCWFIYCDSILSTGSHSIVFKFFISTPINFLLWSVTFSDCKVRLFSFLFLPFFCFVQWCVLLLVLSILWVTSIYLSILSYLFLCFSSCFLLLCFASLSWCELLCFDLFSSLLFPSILLFLICFDFFFLVFFLFWLFFWSFALVFILVRFYFHLFCWFWFALICFFLACSFDLFH